MTNRKLFLLIVIVIALLSFLRTTWPPSNNNRSCSQQEIPESFSQDEMFILYSKTTMVGSRYLVIEGNGSTYYFENMADEKPLAKSAVLSQVEMKSILSVFRENNYLCLEESYQPRLKMTDMGTDEVLFEMNGSAHSVRDYGNSAPSNFRNIADYLTTFGENLSQVNRDEVDDYCEKLRRGIVRKPITLIDWENRCAEAVIESF